MTRAPDRIARSFRRSPRRPAGAGPACAAAPVALSLAVALLAAPAGPAAAQDQPRDDAPAGRRGAVAAYTVVDGVSAPAPLAGLSGDPDRGREVFEDPAAGGCAACHAVGDRPRGDEAPQILLDRMLPPPPLAPEDPAPEAAPEAPSDGISSQPEAPATAPHPLLRAAALAAAEAEAEQNAEAEAAAESLGLAMGPDLAGAAERMVEGRLRLWVIDPSFFGATGMPAYHAVDPALARAHPDLRQPWLSPQQVEDVVAYLLSIGAETGAEDAAAGQGEAEGAQEDAAQDAASPRPDAARPDAAQAGAARPGGAQPDAAKPDADRPGAPEPAAARPDAPPPETSPPAAPDPADQDPADQDLAGQDSAGQDPSGQASAPQDADPAQ